MEKLVKVMTTQIHRRSKTVILCEKEIQFNELGVAEIEENLALQLFETYPNSIEMFDETKIKSIESLEGKDLYDLLVLMSTIELKEIAERQGFHRGEWIYLNSSKRLADYLQKKIDEKKNEAVRQMQQAKRIHEEALKMGEIEAAKEKAIKKAKKTTATKEDTEKAIEDFNNAFKNVK